MKSSVSGLLILVFGSLTLSGSHASAHQEGAPFSGAIIEPVRVHHAHIEDEQRISLESTNGFRDPSGRKRTTFSSTLELAVAWGEGFRLGSEVLIPFSNTGEDRDRYAIGDIELWPIKYAFINQPETILTGALSFGIPTGSKSKGLGSGETNIGALLFFDRAYKNWFFGFNAEIERSLTGMRETEAELAGVLSYSWIRETRGIAPSVPDQRLVPALSLELVEEFGLQGDEKGETRATLIPAFHLWNPMSGWSVRVGVAIPVTSRKESDFAVVLQIGNHFSWGKLSRGVLR